METWVIIVIVFVIVAVLIAIISMSSKSMSSKSMSSKSMSSKSMSSPRNFEVENMLRNKFPLIKTEVLDDMIYIYNADNKILGSIVVDNISYTLYTGSTVKKCYTLEELQVAVQELLNNVI